MTLDESSIFKAETLKTMVSILALVVSCVSLLYSIRSVNNNTRMINLQIKGDGPSIILRDLQMENFPGETRKRIRFNFKNIGKRTAENLEGTIDWYYAPSSEKPYASSPINIPNGIPFNEENAVWVDQGITEDLPKTYFVVKVKYFDSLLGEIKTTKHYTKWVGKPNWLLEHVSKEEKDQFWTK